MDPAVSPGRTDVVSGARPKVVPHGLMCVFHMRAGGHLNRSPASKCAQSAWIARGASDRARVGRAGGLPRALCSHHPSDLGLAQAGDLHVTGPAPGEASVHPRLQPAVRTKCTNSTSSLGIIWGTRRPLLIMNRKAVDTCLVNGIRGAGKTSPARAGVSDHGEVPSWTSSVCLYGQRHECDGRTVPFPKSEALLRCCLPFRVAPIFTPQRGPAANARSEGYNSLVKENVWQRSRFSTMRHLQARSYGFRMAYNTYLTHRLIHQRQHTRVNGARCHILPCASPIPPLSGTDLDDQEHR